MKFLTYSLKGTRVEALSFLSDNLEELRYVKEHYKDALLDREKKHPTGLVLADSVNIAIPHTETAFANEDVFVIGIPQNEIFFHRIDDIDKSISVDMIFLFVIKDPENYLKFLSILTENFASKNFLDLIKHKDLENIEVFLENNVFSLLKT